MARVLDCLLLALPGLEPSDCAPKDQRPRVKELTELLTSGYYACAIDNMTFIISTHTTALRGAGHWQGENRLCDHPLQLALTM